MDFLSEWAARIQRNVLPELPFYLQVGAVLAIGLVADLLRSRDLARRYFSRALMTDAAYTLFYLSHIYEFFLVVPVTGAINAWMSQNTPWARLEVLSGAPPWLQILASILAVEFVSYWYHRAQHASPWLWQLHKIHHSQTQLTPLTTFRIHFVDRMIGRVLLMLPPLILGARPEVLLPIQIFLTVQSLLVHSDVGWTLGPLGRIVVSPAFHELHHSIDRAHYDRNFGPLLTIWDHVFGTALPTNQRATAYGIQGEDIPESFVRQLWVPVIGCWRLATARAHVTPAGSDLGRTGEKVGARSNASAAASASQVS